MMKKTYTVQGMDCASCAMVIEGDLKQQGIQARCNYVKETMEVEFDEKKITEEKIATVVSKAGYSIISST
jgi:Cu+-exporting ATPase